MKRTKARYYGLLLLTLMLALGVREADAQTVEPFTASDIVTLLREGMAQPRIMALIGDGCVERGGTDDVQAVLAAAGAESALLRVVAAISCPEQVSIDPGLVDRSRLGMGFGDEQFFRIPAGSFQMGSGFGRDNERPVHTVTLTRSFYIQRTPVTQGQWREIMGENPSRFSDCGDTCPVERVSWNDVQEFIQRLNQRYPGRNYRLPMEAEWEYAARAGTTGDYGGTGVLDEMGWYRDNSGGRTRPVALKQPNAWGLYDMHGNVWEWVQDWYGAYTAEAKTDPTGPATGSSRVLRGGSWGVNANVARSANRNSSTPTSRNNFSGGFRLARTP